MTVKELYLHAAKLGFTDSLEDDLAFVLAANRALIQIGKIRPEEASVELLHYPPINRVSPVSFSISHKGREELIFDGTSVKCFTFSCDGNGSALIERYDGADYVPVFTVDLASSGSFVRYSGFFKEGDEFITGDVRIRFSGSYSYNVRNVAFYDEVTSDDPDDIPEFANYVGYDMRDMLDRFSAFARRPVLEGETNRPLDSGYEIENNRVLRLSSNLRGTYRVICDLHPALIEYDGAPGESEDRIDLDDDLAAILPLLVCAYILADDEPDKANYYLARYMEEEQRIRAEYREKTPVQYIRNGW